MLTWNLLRLIGECDRCFDIMVRCLTADSNRELKRTNVAMKRWNTFGKFCQQNPLQWYDTNMASL
jgi:hypothetical protein